MSSAAAAFTNPHATAAQSTHTAAVVRCACRTISEYASWVSCTSMNECALNTAGSALLSTTRNLRGHTA